MTWLETGRASKSVSKSTTCEVFLRISMSASWARLYASLSLSENSNATSLATAISCPKVVSSLAPWRFSIDLFAPFVGLGACFGFDFAGISYFFRRRASGKVVSKVHERLFLYPFDRADSDAGRRYLSR